MSTLVDIVNTFTDTKKEETSLLTAYEYYYGEIVILYLDRFIVRYDNEEVQNKFSRMGKMQEYSPLSCMHNRKTCILKHDPSSRTDFAPIFTSRRSRGLRTASTLRLGVSRFKVKEEKFFFEGGGLYKEDPFTPIFMLCISRRGIENLTTGENINSVDFKLLYDDSYLKGRGLIRTLLEDMINLAKTLNIKCEASNNLSSYYPIVRSEILANIMKEVHSNGPELLVNWLNEAIHDRGDTEERNGSTEEGDTSTVGENNA